MVWYNTIPFYHTELYYHELELVPYYFVVEKIATSFHVEDKL
jgi:hypothetical protein